jgi:hypothetical protein
MGVWIAPAGFALRPKKVVLLRHARLRLTPSTSVLTLVIAMIEPSFGALLVTPVGGPLLLAPGRGHSANK